MQLKIQPKSLCHLGFSMGRKARLGQFICTRCQPVPGPVWSSPRIPLGASHCLVIHKELSYDPPIVGVNFLCGRCPVPNPDPRVLETDKLQVKGILWWW